MQDGLKLIGQSGLHELLGDIGDGVILTDSEERVLFLNEAAKQILSFKGTLQGTELFKDICPLVNLVNGGSFESPLQ